MSEANNATMNKKAGIFGATAFAIALSVGAATAQNSQKNDSANSKHPKTQLPKDSTQSVGKNVGGLSSGVSPLFANFNTKSPSDPYFPKDKIGTPDKKIAWHYSEGSSQPIVFIKPTMTQDPGEILYLGYNEYGSYFATGSMGILKYDGEKLIQVSNAPDHLYNSENMIKTRYDEDLAAMRKTAAQHPKGNSGSDASNKNAGDAGTQAGEGIFSGKDPQGILKDTNGTTHKLIRPVFWTPGSNLAGTGPYVEPLPGGSANMYMLIPAAGTEGNAGKRNYSKQKLSANEAQRFLPQSSGVKK